MSTPKPISKAGGTAVVENNILPTSTAKWKVDSSSKKPAVPVAPASRGVPTILPVPPARGVGIPVAKPPPAPVLPKIAPAPYTKPSLKAPALVLSKASAAVVRSSAATTKAKARAKATTSKATAGGKKASNKRSAGTALGKKGTGSAANQSTPTQGQTVQKKRPYRRTKRPKNYCDKSTVTTTTPAAETPVNVYDAVLGEAEDLLKAAQEAQALGRLKMASAYQLLSHARLVGLGKLFDRTLIYQQGSCSYYTSNGEDESPGPTATSQTKEANLTSTVSPASNGNPTSQASPDQKSLTSSDSNKVTPSTTDSSCDVSTPQHQSSAYPAKKAEDAVNQLAQFLPSNIEMDQAMMEHLARAAAELHHQRTGRKKSSDGLLASPPVNQEVFQQRKNSNTSGNSDSTAGTPTNAVSATIDTNSSENGKNKSACKSVVWTKEEQLKFQEATKESSDPAQISKKVGSRNEAQVKAYMRNIAEREKGAAAMEEEILEETPRKRGGRGRKPPTTAMNTVPNANVNAKKLLQGNLLH